MRVSETIARLRQSAPRAVPGDGRLSELADFGSNPGNLRALHVVPKGIKGPMPLVVVLHGCTQTAASYDAGSGWSRLAERHGFALLFPEQKRANNPNLCFTWFSREDTRRGGGEAESIAQMTRRMTADFPIDRSRIFVTGLSAGGAMTSVMLAAYPDLFAAGAIIAGIAYGCAGSVGEAFECMGGRGRGSAKALGDSVRAASPHKGPWPRVSVWHGSNDTTVTASNGDDVVKQWLNVHGLKAAAAKDEPIGDHRRRAWSGPDGTPIVEQYLIAGMGHGTPLAPGEEIGQSGIAGPHMLDAAISSTDRIAAFFGLAEAVAEPSRKPPPARHATRSRAAPVSGIQKVIEDALRSAGLKP